MAARELHHVNGAVIVAANGRKSRRVAASGLNAAFDRTADTLNGRPARKRSIREITPSPQRSVSSHKRRNTAPSWLQTSSPAPSYRPPSVSRPSQLVRRSQHQDQSFSLPTRPLSISGLSSENEFVSPTPHHRINHSIHSTRPVSPATTIDDYPYGSVMHSTPSFANTSVTTFQFARPPSTPHSIQMQPMPQDIYSHQMPIDGSEYSWEPELPTFAIPVVEENKPDPRTFWQRPPSHRSVEPEYLPKEDLYSRQLQAASNKMSISPRIDRFSDPMQSPNRSLPSFSYSSWDPDDEEDALQPTSLWLQPQDGVTNANWQSRDSEMERYEDTAHFTDDSMHYTF